MGLGRELQDQESTDKGYTRSFMSESWPSGQVDEIDELRILGSALVDLWLVFIMLIR